jgi:hypothetical protein
MIKNSYKVKKATTPKHFKVQSKHEVMLPKNDKNGVKEL